MRQISYAGMARRKASPGGEAGSPQGLTDEVEADDYHHRLVQNCSLRPHPVRLGPDHRSRGMTATGSHIDSYSLRGAPPSRGRLFLCPGRLLRRFLLLKHCYLAHRGMPTPLPCHAGRFCPFAPQHSKSPGAVRCSGGRFLHFSSVFSGFSASFTGCSSTLGMKFRATLPFPLLFT